MVDIMYNIKQPIAVAGIINCYLCVNVIVHALTMFFTYFYTNINRSVIWHAFYLVPASIMGCCVLFAVLMMKPQQRDAIGIRYVKYMLAVTFTATGVHFQHIPLCHKLHLSDVAMYIVIYIFD